MKVIQTEIPGVLVIEPDVFADERGAFCETYKDSWLSQLPAGTKFIQDNESVSKKGALRGLHFQRPPFAQGKLVRVAYGSALDVVVDLRHGSATYGKSLSLELSAQNHKMLWVPEGFAHGFLSLEDGTVFLYRVTNVYDKSSEGGIIWNDPDLGIDWGSTAAIVSAKDGVLPRFRELGRVF